MLLLDTEQIPGTSSAGGSMGCFRVSGSERGGQTGRSVLAVSVRGLGGLGVQPGASELWVLWKEKQNETKQHGS